MSIGTGLLRVILMAGAIWLAAPSASVAQGDPCADPDMQRSCAVLCCGRSPCAPSCQADCVKTCVDSCRAPALRPAFSSRLPDLQNRCGYKTAPTRGR